MSSDSCPSCNIVYINGVKCHETGCPNAWQDNTRECNWCGTPFTPRTKHQDCCSPDCAEAYHG